MKYAQRFSLAIAVLSVAALLAGSATPAAADNGDCSQPVSSGPNPVATDCLYILRTAVGLLTCTPTCICDLNDSGGNPNATDSLSCLNAAVGVPNLLNCDCGGGTTTTTVVDGTTTTTVDGGTTTTTDGGSTTTTTIGGGGGACPDTVELTLYAGTGGTCTTNGDCEAGTCDAGLSRCITVTELDTGWTGISHDADVNDDQVTIADLTCAAGSAPCGVCTVDGINPVNNSCRCANDNRAICDQPFVADADDCGGNVCNCYLGPPLPLSAGNTPACVVNRFANDVTGTVNVDTGDAQGTINLRSVVFLGVNIITPCPYCDGDTTAGDGVRDGSCVEGPNDGQTCDSDAINSTFPSPGGNGSSLDCFPDPGVNVSGAGLQIDLAQTTGTDTLGSDVVCGFPPTVIQACHCGICKEGAVATTIPCASTADCVTAGSSGTCERVGVLDPSPSKCLGATQECAPLPDGDAECTDGPTDKYCDLVVRANGDGFVQCNQNADCTNSGFDGGECTISEQRECFLPTIEVEGAPDPSFPVAAAIFCIPPTSNPAINTVAGLPGPGRVTNQARTVKYCGGLGGDVYEANTGCP